MLSIPTVRLYPFLNGEQLFSSSPQYSVTSFVLFRCGWEDGVIIARYGQKWATQRKMNQRTLAKATIPEHSTVREEEVNLLLQGLSEQPREYVTVLRR